jgi:hypothetical protein
MQPVVVVVVVDQVNIGAELAAHRCGANLIPLLVVLEEPAVAHCKVIVELSITKQMATLE